MPTTCPARTCSRRLVRHFRDPRVGAVMGRCVIRNGVESTLARSIAIDYLSGYLVNEYGRQALFELPGVRRGQLRGAHLDAARARWLEPRRVTEDTDLTLRVLLARPAGPLRRHRGRLRGGRGNAPALLDAALPLGPGPPEVWRDYRCAMLRSPHLSVVEKLESHDVPARLPRAGAVRARRCCSPACASPGSATRYRSSGCCRCRPCCSPGPSASSPSASWWVAPLGGPPGRWRG